MVGGWTQWSSSDTPSGSGSNPKRYFFSLTAQGVMVMALLFLTLNFKFFNVLKHEFQEYIAESP